MAHINLDTFVNEIQAGKNQKQAAIAAGAAPKSASATAYKLMQKASVKAAIAAAKSEEYESLGVNRQWVVAGIKHDIEQARLGVPMFNPKTGEETGRKPDYASSLRGADLLTKILGMTKEKDSADTRIEITINTVGSSTSVRAHQVPKQLPRPLEVVTNAVE